MPGKQGSLPTKPLEFNDFSGGITENILQGDPRRYERADNFFITNDHKLQERLGFLPESDTAYKIDGFEGQRINNYHIVHNDTVRIPQAGRSLFYLNQSDAWAEIHGIAGNQALSGGTSNSQTTTSEFQRVVYLATDSPDNGVLPSKIYLNESNNWVAKTAGLPRAWISGNYTDATLLQKCIANANAIRSAMILHFQDAKYPTYHTPSSGEVAPGGELHVNIDRYSLCYLQTVSDFSPTEPKPNPFPTPQGPATDQDSLFHLLGVLNTIYTFHIGDAMCNSWGTQVGDISVVPIVKPTYHQDNPLYTYSFPNFNFPEQRTKGPGAPLNGAQAPTSVSPVNPATPPSTLLEAASMVDDLLQKWNWHRKAVNTHAIRNDSSIFDIYQPDCTTIGLIQEGSKSFPTVTPDWSDIIGFANNLKYIYNAHVTGIPTGAGHKMRDNFIYNMGFECKLPDATNIDDAFLLIYWLRSLYQLHYADAAQVVTQFFILKFNTTAGSNVLSSVTQNSTGATYDGSFSVGQFVEISSGVQFNPVANKNNGLSTSSYITARVTAGASGTLTLDSTCATSTTGSLLQIAIPMYHDWRASGVLQDNATNPTEQAADQLGDDVTSLGNDTASWLLLGQDLFFALSSHISYQTVHLGIGSTYLANLLLTSPSKPFYLPSVETASYAMFFQDKYTVEPNGIEYLVRGNPVFSSSLDLAVSYPAGAVPPNLYPTIFTGQQILNTKGNLLTGLPVLVNDATTNYDTENITLELYRTTDGGQTFFHLASLANGTTQYLDMVNDSLEATDGTVSLDEGETLYTTGGVVGDDQPPIAKFTHILNGVAYWGGITDAGQFFPNRMRQSKVNEPDAAPGTFFDDFDSPIVGISSARNNVITLCSTSIYRESGQFNSQGQGQLTHENISDTLGCLNAKSIIRTEIGVFFAGTDGFYYTDGYQIINITLEWKNTYAKMTETENQRRSIYGGYDKIQRRIWWAMKQGEYDSDNSVVYVFYLNYGVKPSGVFTTISNGLNFRPSSLVFQNGIAYYAHEKGYLFKLDQWNKWDAVIDDNELVASDWEHGVIPYDYKSVAIDLGTTFQRKWIPRIHIVGKNTGNMGIQAYANRDVNQYNQGAVPMAPINYAQNCTWGDPNFVWGDPNFVWKTDGKMDLWRRIPAGQLRSDFMQIQFKPAYLPVYASSLYPEFCFAEVISGTTTKVVQIQSPPGREIIWPLDVVGYDLALSFDEYQTTFPILSIVSPNEISVDDPLNVLPVSEMPFDWQIMGVKKEQNVFMTSFVLHYAYLGDENQSYPGSSTDSGPGNAGANP